MIGSPFPMEAPPVVIDLGIHLETWFGIARKVSAEEAHRRSLISWCLTHQQPYPTWMSGPVQYLGFPYGHREQLLCRLNTRWRDGQDPGPYDKDLPERGDLLYTPYT